ncbi:MAG: hypothetical protein HC849_30745 [Oscillatoriales cyanobacterium RU_3_3]|nr:hypothetical protein [Oscillatoriales cyanobacterium RU_3_3]
MQWFSLLVGTKLAFATALSLLVCGTGTYWLLQGWQRRFSNPSATVLSKRQSYLFVACCQAIFLGFFLPFNSRNSAEIVLSLLIFNWIFFLVLIAALTPDRQSLYDWARYRKQIVPSNRKLWLRYLLLDLIWSEKSPAVVAIALNSMIPLLILIPWLPRDQSLELVLIWVVLETNLITIYATIAQLFLLAKNRYPAVLALTFAVSTIAFFGYLIFLVYLLENTIWHIFGDRWTDLISLILMLLMIIGPWTVLVLLNLKLMRQLKLAGESASKALLKA